MQFSSNNGMILLITGNIATGKSYLLRILRRLGFCTIQMDQFTDRCLKDEKIVQKIVRDLSEELNVDLTEQLVSQNGELNKKKLSQILFSSDQTQTFTNTISTIEKVIFPLALSYQQKLIQKIAIHGKRSIAIESPLFLEANNPLEYHALIVTIASRFTQKKRAFMRKDMTNEKFLAIVSRQLSNEEKKAKADLIICNEGNKYATISSIQRIVKRHGSTERDSIGYRNYWTRTERWSSHHRNWLRRTGRSTQNW